MNIFKHCLLKGLVWFLMMVGGFGIGLGACSLALAEGGVSQGTPTKSVLPEQSTMVQPNVFANEVCRAGWMTLYPDGGFHPEYPVTRAELAHIVVKAFDLNKRKVHPLEGSPEASIDQLSDVPPSHWAISSIQTALKTHTMAGYYQGDGRFYPEQKVTRGEGFAILAQAYGVFSFGEPMFQSIFAQYTDINQVPVWAQKAMATVLHEGFVNTTVDSKTGLYRIRPQELLTRGDIAFALGHYLERRYRPESSINDLLPPQVPPNSP